MLKITVDKKKQVVYTKNIDSKDAEKSHKGFFQRPFLFKEFHRRYLFEIQKMTKCFGG